VASLFEEAGLLVVFMHQFLELFSRCSHKCRCSPHTNWCRIRRPL